MELNFKELPFLDILIKSKKAKLSQIFITNPQTLNNTSIPKVITHKLHKIHPLHPST